MSRSRSMMGGLAVAAAAGLTLAGCHSGAAALGGGSTPTAGSSAPTVSGSTGSGSTGSGSTGSGSTGSGSTGSGSTIGGSGAASYFPITVGDTWVYAVNLAGQKDTTTNKVAAVSPVAAGRQLTMAITTSNPATTNSFRYVVHPDGSIDIPSFGTSQSSFKVKSGSIGWPSPAQLASGQSFSSKIVVTGSEEGTTITETINATFKGEGTQSVTVPAGTYSATLMDEVETENILGQKTSFDTKTWLVNGIGPVKTVLTARDGSSASLDETTELTSFTKG